MDIIKEGDTTATVAFINMVRATISYCTEFIDAHMDEIKSAYPYKTSRDIIMGEYNKTVKSFMDRRQINGLLIFVNDNNIGALEEYIMDSLEPGDLYEFSFAVDRFDGYDNVTLKSRILNQVPRGALKTSFFEHIESSVNFCYDFDSESMADNTVLMAYNSYRFTELVTRFCIESVYAKTDSYNCQGGICSMITGINYVLQNILNFPIGLDVVDGKVIDVFVRNGIAITVPPLNKSFKSSYILNIGAELYVKS